MPGRSYQDALPLDRQERILKRIGVELPRATLATWMVRLGPLIQPLINLMREAVLAYDIVQMDETTVQVLNEPGRSAQSQSYLWVQRGGPPEHPLLLYEYDPSRSQEVPKRLLDDYHGYLPWDAGRTRGANSMRRSKRRARRTQARQRKRVGHTKG